MEVARAEVASVSESARKLAEEKISLLARVVQKRVELSTHRVNCVWALKYLQRGREKFFANLEDFRKAILTLFEVKERKLRKLSLEYDEELYPHLVSTVSERR